MRQLYFQCLYTILERKNTLYTRLRLSTKVFIYIRHQINTWQIHFHYQNHPQIRTKWSGKRSEKRKAAPSSVHLLILVRKCNHKLKGWQRQGGKNPQETHNAKPNQQKDRLSLTPFCLKINRDIRDCAFTASVHKYLYDMPSSFYRWA